MNWGWIAEDIKWALGGGVFTLLIQYVRARRASKKEEEEKNRLRSYAKQQVTLYEETIDQLMAQSAAKSDGIRAQLDLALASLDTAIEAYKEAGDKIAVFELKKEVQLWKFDPASPPDLDLVKNKARAMTRAEVDGPPRESLKPRTTPAELVGEYLAVPLMASLMVFGVEPLLSRWSVTSRFARWLTRHFDAHVAADRAKADAYFESAAVSATASASPAGNFGPPVWCVTDGAFVGACVTSKPECWQMVDFPSRFLLRAMLAWESGSMGAELRCIPEDPQQVVYCFDSSNNNLRKPCFQTQQQCEEHDRDDHRSESDCTPKAYGVLEREHYAAARQASFAWRDAGM